MRDFISPSKNPCRILPHSRPLQFKDILDDTDLQFRVWRLRIQLRGGDHITGKMLSQELSGLLGQVVVCLSRHKFAYIPAPNDSYFEIPMPFGNEVFDSFPEIRQEIRDAANCIAACLFTASVFHLMRVSEHGLRTLARTMKVSIKHKGKTQPTDTATWDKVIVALKKKIDAAHAAKHGPVRAKKLAFYSDMADRCSYVKDLWRNDVMHAGKSYSYHEASAVFERVKGFMQLLAKE